ncbi:MAG: HAMP domain-containing protein [Chloroflexaceae bacterium]|nr:HAMP domain-containing protein [Chloroflexaceae bacterium]
MLPNRWNSLKTRLFLAHVLVIIVGVATLLIATLTIGPELHDALMRAMVGPYAQIVLNVDDMQEMEHRVSVAFRTTLIEVLGISVTAAILTALAVSLFVSTRIVTLLQRVLIASNRIAAGHYSERVPPGDIAELNQLAVHFNTMAAALDKAEHRRVALIGDVAHELRTPLATIESYTEGLLDGVVPPSDEIWGILNDESGRLRRLVNDLHMLSRVEARQIPLSLTPIQPATLVAQVVARLAPQYTDKNVMLTSEVPETLPVVHGDSDRLIQVFINILGNALRYTPSGGSVHIHAEYQHNNVFFHIADTGIGIDSEQLPHVFERFYRVDKARSRSLGGSGIGLTIAQALIEAHGGRIWATSDGPGHGATFSFTLPA